MPLTDEDLAPLKRQYRREHWEACIPLIEDALSKLPGRIVGRHHADIVIRINGEDRRYEGDWLTWLPLYVADLQALRAENARLREALQAAAAKARSIKAESQTQHEALLTVGMICEAALTELIPRPPSG